MMKPKKNLGEFLPGAAEGYSSGLPYVAIPVNGDILGSAEQVVFALNRAKINPPFLFDLKNDFLQVRYAVTRSQKKIICDVLNDSAARCM